MPVKTSLTDKEIAIANGAKYKFASGATKLKVNQDGSIDVFLKMVLVNPGAATLQKGSSAVINFDSGVFDITQPDTFKSDNSGEIMLEINSNDEITLKSARSEISFLTGGDKGKQGSSALRAEEEKNKTYNS